MDRIATEHRYPAAPPASRRWRVELEELAADTYRRFRKFGEDEEALAALKLWLDAAHARHMRALAPDITIVHALDHGLDASHRGA